MQTRIINSVEQGINKEILVLKSSHEVLKSSHDCSGKCACKKHNAQYLQPERYIYDQYGKILITIPSEYINKQTGHIFIG
jgi:hypothetical protein